MKVAAALAAAGALLFPSPVGASGEASQRPAWLPRLFYSISLCETGGNWSHATRDYVSAFGIFRGAWADYRPKWVPSVPELATPKQQYAVALAIASRAGLTAWECYRNGGVNYWMRRVQ